MYLYHVPNGARAHKLSNTHTHTHTHTHKHTHTHIPHTHTHTHACTHARTHARTHTHTRTEKKTEQKLNTSFKYTVNFNQKIRTLVSSLHKEGNIEIFKENLELILSLDTAELWTDAVLHHGDSASVLLSLVNCHHADQSTGLDGVWSRAIIGGNCHKYYFCRDKSSVASNICCDKHNFVATKVLSGQAYFCRDKTRLLPQQKHAC